MERMLVVVFDNEKKAYEGKTALGQLQAEGNLTIYQGAVILKHADGTVSVKQLDEDVPVGTIRSRVARARERVMLLSQVVFDAGYASPVRTPRGRDIMAACGQLKSASVKQRASARLTQPA